MSRCFPFPPPGYERKARNGDGDLLEKKQHRDKKQKKEKKDKEKKEGKEKRDKDRSDGKHREKKDKKEKHRDNRDKDKDKKRDKEKDSDKAKDKSKATDEKRLSGQSDPHGGEKLGQKESREKSNSVDKKLPGQIGGHKVEKLSQNCNLVDESKLVKDFGRRIKDDATGTGNHMENISTVDRKKDEGVLRLVPKSTSSLAAVKEKDKRAEIKPAEGQGARDGIRPGANATVQSTAGTVQNKFEGPPRLLDKNVERTMEGNENTKDKENDDKRGVKSQEKDKERKSHGKDKDRDREKEEDREKKKEDREKRKEDKQKKKEEKQRKKEDREKKKEEKAREKEKEKEKEKERTQLQNAELDKLRGSNQHDVIDNHTVKPPQLPKPTNSVGPTDANPKKRKDYETNGVVHAQDILPSKLPRPPPSSSHPPLENGRILEHCQTSVLALDRKVASTNTKTDNKERKINGITEVQPPSVSPMKVKPTTPPTDQTAKPAMRPPHPDTKYLSQVYSVPKMEEWFDYDDQEWLFDGISSQPKKPKVNPSSSEEALQVWAEARQIESADIFALPYVIPY